jgi:hypothetical protein
MFFIGLFLFYLSKKISKQNQILLNRFAVIYMIGVLLVLLFNTLSLFGVRNEIELKIVDGVIENFHPMPYNGHDFESFTVKEIKFRYSDYNSWGGFNKTSSHGGPINHNGQHVRITYYEEDNENIICKLEMLKTQ